MIPILQQVFPRAYEVDRGMFAIYNRSLDESPDDILLHLTNLKVMKRKDIQIGMKDWVEGSPCFVLQEGAIPASFSVARKAQMMIAEDIGLLPAKFYEMLPDHYDQGFVQLYGKMIRAWCVGNQPCCIRPGHLRVVTEDKEPLKSMFTLDEITSLHDAVRRAARGG